MQDKSDFRKKVLRVLSEGPAGDAVALWQAVEALPEFIAASTVLIYWSMPSEVPTQAFIGRWCAGKRFVLPLVAGGSLVLKEYVPGRLEAGYRGIMEPTSEAPEVCPEDIDFAIVPGVAFDRNCMRMGRGKGFYDRLIPHLKCPLAGVCFPSQLFDRIPVDPWDRQLDMVVTENGIIKKR